MVRGTLGRADSSPYSALRIMNSTAAAGLANNGGTMGRIADEKCKAGMASDITRPCQSCDCGSEWRRVDQWVCDDKWRMHQKRLSIW